jgi:hypothetical protein
MIDNADHDRSYMLIAFAVCALSGAFFVGMLWLVFG